MEWPIRFDGKFSNARQRHAAGLVLGTIAAVLMVCAPLIPFWLVLIFAPGLCVLVWFIVTAASVQTDAALRESERKFRNFVEQSLVGLYVVQDGKIAYANSRTAELLGYDTADELLGLHLEQVTAQEDLPMLMENHRRRLTGEVTTLRYTYGALRRDGKRVWVDV
ncbi:MAG TPA: PAS domain S-box protein [Noviherbaspirillum sp.]